MRLLTKTTFFFLTAMTILLVVAGFYLFSRLSKELNSKSDQELLYEETVWVKYLHTETARGIRFILRAPDVSIYPVDVAGNRYPEITDVRGGPDNTLYRQLTDVVPVYGVPYQIILRKSQEQKAALIAYTTKIILIVFAGLFIATLVFIWLISKNLWTPFYRSLHTIRQADLQNIQKTRFEKNTPTKEFNELNRALNAMTEKIHNDFINMKEFTENAAHEMQTPLSIAQSKLELLLQNEQLGDEDVQSIIEASTSLARLAKLNQELLMLAKIENQQYSTTETISLNEVTKKYLGLFSELIEDKKLTVQTNMTSDFKIELHPLLADTLVSNLLGNAVKHNHPGGDVEIAVTANSYSISNTSRQGPIPQEKLFRRFASAARAEAGSTGLGLAIVKKIADIHGLTIGYEFRDGVTKFELIRK